MAERTRVSRLLVGVVAGPAFVLSAVGAASAAHEAGPELRCGEAQYVLRPDAGNWGAAKLEGTERKLIPVRYSITANTSAGDVHGPFVTEKGGGRAHPNQETIECTFSAFREDLVDPVSGEVVDVTFTVAVTAVDKEEGR